MVNSIVEHNNNSAYEQVVPGRHKANTQPDGSWKETTPGEINRLIALLKTKIKLK